MANVDIMRRQRQESLPEIRIIAIKIEVIVVISFVSPVSPTPSPASRPCSNAPVRCPTGSGRTPDTHGQPEGLMQVLPVPDWGIAYAGF